MSISKTRSILYTTARILGDVDANGVFEVKDLILMQKWLLAAPDTKLADWQAGDLCEDGALNVFDLSLMKRLLAQQK